MVLSGFVQAGSHDFSCTPHNLQGNPEALLHRFQAQIIEKYRLTLPQQHSGQQLLCPVDESIGRCNEVDLAVA